MFFCNDTDLMHWEPNVFRDASAVAQTLIAGTGDLAGTSFTLASGSLTAAQVAAGCVAVLDGTINASLPVLSVASATQMTLSVLWGDLSNPVETNSAAGVPYSVRTFSAQSKLVSDLLRQAVGIADDPEATIINPEALRRPCAMGTLMLLYRALAASASSGSGVWLTRADMYERLYTRSLRAAKVDLDLDGDGIADTRRELDLVRWTRS